ncbi:MAG: calcium/sodium antiporter [Acidobacteria bacterium]|nr:MAG: calcium/sodium antiporter [Acidobacteriota bacterium]REJ99270.1 MAG: calcium/sodium antiporter [Acidobacteriota bacterium]REK16009.1 MAG: calcium/sodium antiporter [Acidobacteriota bacterium]REK43690.1 MAG: calcium/sodium antiporter [Acidobacteriota bacterium]
MTLAIVALIGGLILLIWSADRFVEGAASTAKHFGMPPLLIGMVIVGFGTSAPEMVVSAFAAAEGNAGIAVGNAYGSNIANIGLILGVSAIIFPITVDSAVLRKELPVLSLITALVAVQLYDSGIGRFDAALLLAIFGGLMFWTVREGLRKRKDKFAEDVELELEKSAMPITRAIAWLVAGLALLIVSSRLLVWGAVEIATSLGISDLIIGLTVVALGTSLPELASSIIAARNGEDDLALGNILGSNLFNTLAVVGIAGMISPFDVGPEVLWRDVVVMSVLTVSIFLFGYGFGRTGRINRYEGAVLTVAYVAYASYLISTVV